MINYMNKDRNIRNFHCDSVSEFHKIAKEVRSINPDITVTYSEMGRGIFLNSNLDNGWGEQFQLCYWFKYNSPETRAAIRNLVEMINR